MCTTVLLLPVGILVAVAYTAPVFVNEHRVARGVPSIKAEFLDPIIVDTRSIAAKSNADLIGLRI